MMLRTLYIYSWLSERELNKVVLEFQENFEFWLGDHFTEPELTKYENLLDDLAFLDVQPKIIDLRPEDLNLDQDEYLKQQAFFEGCQSTVSFENIPYLPINPFQVTYLKMFLERLGEVLIDCGDESILQFKNNFLQKLKGYKDAEDLIEKIYIQTPVVAKGPSHPIDFIILDIYKELSRLKTKSITINLEEYSDKIKKIYEVMKEEGLDSNSLLVKSGLNAKDFGDLIERFKFILKKI